LLPAPGLEQAEIETVVNDGDVLQRAAEPIRRRPGALPRIRRDGVESPNERLCSSQSKPLDPPVISDATSMCVDERTTRSSDRGNEKRLDRVNVHDPVLPRDSP
jgi:hypothetical protein